MLVSPSAMMCISKRCEAVTRLANVYMQPTCSSPSTFGVKGGRTTDGLDYRWRCREHGRAVKARADRMGDFVKSPALMGFEARLRGARVLSVRKESTRESMKRRFNIVSAGPGTL